MVKKLTKTHIKYFI